MHARESAALRINTAAPATRCWVPIGQGLFDGWNDETSKQFPYRGAHKPRSHHVSNQNQNDPKQGGQQNQQGNQPGQQGGGQQKPGQQQQQPGQGGQQDQGGQKPNPSPQR